MKLKIGNVIGGNIVLAPMEDVSDLAFRLTCKHYGAGIVYTEICHSRSILHGNIKRAITSQEERPVGIQVAGGDVNEVVEAAKVIEKNADIIDINLGCPGTNVIASGAGSALLRQPELIGEIVRKLVEAVKKPVTAKMRAGWSSEENALTIAKTIEKSGAAALTVHPRTMAQKYSGKADWSIIGKIKKTLKIPIIGNGDVRNGKDAQKMLDETKCDGVMIGRAAIGDPLIFQRVKTYLETGEEIKNTTEEKIGAFEMYCEYAKKFGLYNKLRVLRQAQQMTRYLDGAAEFRTTICRINDVDEIKRKAEEFISQETHEPNKKHD